MNSNITIFFLRHGLSSGDDEGVHEGRCDAALTEIGRAQAQKRDLNWKEEGVKFDLILSNSLQRAHQWWLARRCHAPDNSKLALLQALVWIGPITPQLNC